MQPYRGNALNIQEEGTEQQVAEFVTLQIELFDDLAIEILHRFGV
jgi:hypothetical protein